MFQNNASLESHIIKKSGLGFFTGLAVWFIALMHGAVIVRDAAIGEYYSVRLGPFITNELAKLPLAQGFTIRLTFEFGILWYLALCCAIGALTGLIMHRLSRK